MEAISDPAISEWGNPFQVMLKNLYVEFINIKEQTAGSEISQYRKEEKVITIS